MDISDKRLILQKRIEDLEGMLERARDELAECPPDPVGQPEESRSPNSLGDAVFGFFVAATITGLIIVALRALLC